MILPISHLKKFFQQRSEIHTALIYGSYAKNRLKKDSDIDFAIFLKHSPKNIDYQLSLSLALDKICHRETDILILNMASPHIAFRAIREGKIIFQRKDRSPWSRFVVKTINMNEDMELLYRKVRHG